MDENQDSAAAADPFRELLRDDGAWVPVGGRRLRHVQSGEVFGRLALPREEDAPAWQALIDRLAELSSDQLLPPRAVIDDVGGLLYAEIDDAGEESFAEFLEGGGAGDQHETMRMAADLAAALAQLHRAGVVLGRLRLQDVLRTEQGWTLLLTPGSGARVAAAGEADKQARADLVLLASAVVTVLTGRRPSAQRARPALRDTHPMLDPAAADALDQLLDPAAMDPVAGDPVARDPVAKGPAVRGSAAGGPAAGGPAVGGPAVEGRRVADPGADARSRASSGMTAADLERLLRSCALAIEDPWGDRGDRGDRGDQGDQGNQGDQGGQRDQGEVAADAGGVRPVREAPRASVGGWHRGEPDDDPTEQLPRQLPVSELAAVEGLRQRASRSIPDRAAAARGRGREARRTPWVLLGAAAMVVGAGTLAGWQVLSGLGEDPGRAAAAEETAEKAAPGGAWPETASSAELPPPAELPSDAEAPPNAETPPSVESPSSAEAPASAEAPSSADAEDEPAASQPQDGVAVSAEHSPEYAAASLVRLRAEALRTGDAELLEAVYAPGAADLEDDRSTLEQTQATGAFADLKMALADAQPLGQQGDDALVDEDQDEASRAAVVIGTAEATGTGLDPSVEGQGAVRQDVEIRLVVDDDGGWRIADVAPR